MQLFHQNGVLYILAQDKLLTYNIAEGKHQLNNIAIGHADFSSSPLATAILDNKLYGKVNWGASFPVNKGFGTVDLESLTISENDIIGMNTDTEIQSNSYNMMASAYDREDELFYFTFGSWWGGGTGRIYNKNGTLAGSFTGVEDSPEQMAISYAVMNQSPFLQKPLEAVALYERETIEMAFDDYFKDNDDDALTYTLTMSDDEALPDWISFNEGRLTAKAGPNPLAMTLSLTVKAEDPYLESVSKQFELEIIPIDDAPVVANPLADIVVDENAEAFRISLVDVFDDEDSENAAMQFSVIENSNTALVQTAIETNELILSFTPDEFGEADVTIQVTSDSKSVANTFKITVRESVVTGLEAGFATLNIYPNPVVNDLHITAGGSGPLSVRIVKTDGTMLYENNARVSNVTVDVSTLAAGIYVLELSNGDQRITKRIIKN